MTQYERMLSLAADLGMRVYEMDFRSNVNGIIKGKKIGIRKGLSEAAKACAVCEEIGHDQTGVGNIIDQNTVQMRKQEFRAREWAYKCMIPLDQIIDAHKSHITCRHEFAQLAEVTEEFLQAAINRYTSKFGIFMQYNEKYTICFDPLRVIELYSD